MNTLNNFKNFLFALLNVKLIASNDCPAAEEVDPCICVENEINKIYISCTGEEINDENIIPVMENLNNHLLSRPQTLLKLFRIQETSITFINDEVFEKLPFVEMEIYDNQLLNLNTLSERTFFTALHTLKSFYASNNDLVNSDGSKLVSLFSLFSALEYLTIRENKITKIDQNSFSNEDQYWLKFIDLSSNEISFVGENAFYSLSNLVHLNLGNNSLESLETNSLAIKHSSSTPMQLILQSNKLTTHGLNEEVFTGLQRPLILLMQNNNLDHFPENVFSSLVEDQTNYLIDVTNNPFMCDCEKHKWLFQIGKHKRAKILNLVCGQITIWEYESQVSKNCF
jgi:hypothetical protein